MRNEAVSAVIPGVKLNDLTFDLSKVTVGFELEFVSPVSHQAFADAMKANDPDYKIGAVTDLYAGHKELFKGRKDIYKFWHVTGDDTIQVKDIPADNKNVRHFAIEVISPALPINRAKGALSGVLDVIHSVGGLTNSSCGLHVTFGHPSLSPDLANFDPLKFSVFLQEDKLLARFDRERNEFAQNFSSRILQAMYEEMHELHSRVFQRNAPDFNEEDEGNYPDGYSLITPSDETGPALTEENLKEMLTSLKVRQRFALYSHYMSINLIKLRKHCVEVRSPGGDYLNRPTAELTQMVMHMARCLALAMDSSLLEDKYLLAVQRMLKQYNPNKSNTDFTRTQQEIKIEDSAKTKGKTQLTGYVKIAKHSVQLTITHGDATNPKSEASASWSITGNGRARTVMRLYVDNLGSTEAVIPAKEALDAIPGSRAVLASLCADLLKVSDQGKPLPGLLRIAPSVSSYKQLLARFPKLASLKVNVDQLKADLADREISSEGSLNAA